MPLIKAAGWSVLMTAALLAFQAGLSGGLVATYLRFWVPSLQRRGTLRLFAQPIGAAKLEPVTIVGANGRIGSLFASLGRGKDTLVGRESTIAADATGPILVATRNDVLGSIVDTCPASRRSDLVFMQNGYLENFLEEKGLSDNTQALIYFAVSNKSEAPIDGKTQLNPAGLTKVTGKWARVFAERCYAAGLACEVVDAEDYRTAMFEKLIWISAFMLIGALHGGITIGEVEATRRTEVVALIEELAGAVANTQGVEFGPDISQRLCAYARSVAHFPTAIKEFEWRNGYFWKLSKAAEDCDRPDPCPTHTDYCNAALLADLVTL